MDVLTPRTLDEALRLKAEHPDARPIAGGTDVLVELNFDRTRPDGDPQPERGRGAARLVDARTATLRARRRRSPTPRRCARRSPSCCPALAEASRTVGSPQIRNRGTIGGNLGTASPAGDALPPLLVEEATVELASVRGVALAAADRVPRRRRSGTRSADDELVARRAAAAERRSRRRS